MLRRRFRTAYSVCCERGDARQVNQDAVLARCGEAAGHRIGLFMVADGCGGMDHGEAISRLLSESFDRIWEEALPDLFSSQKDPEPLPALCGWLRRVNEVAYDFGCRIGGRVGSTLSLLLTLDSRYYILNVGDSRIYLRRGGRLTQLTEDQSLLADMLRNGEISPEEAAVFPRRNVLTMCVGYFKELQIFQTEGKLRRGDLFLLCSDGLYHGVGEARLLEAMPFRVSPEGALLLRSRIPHGGAADNVSAVLVEILP